MLSDELSQEMKSIPPYKHTSCSQNSFCSKLSPEATAGWAGRGYPDAGIWEHGTGPTHIKKHFSRLSSAVALHRIQNLLPAFLDIQRRTPELCWRGWTAWEWPLAWDQLGPGDTRLQSPLSVTIPGLTVPLEQTVTKAEPSLGMTKINETYCKPLWNAHDIFISLLHLLINDTIIPTHAMRADSSPWRVWGASTTPTVIPALLHKSQSQEICRLWGTTEVTH